MVLNTHKICRDCLNICQAGKSRCREHLAIRRDQQKARIKKRNARKICHCGLRAFLRGLCVWHLEELREIERCRQWNRVAEQGKCHECGRPSLPQSIRCSYHLGKQAARREAMREDAKEYQYCVDCGDARPNGRMRCSACLERDRLRKRGKAGKPRVSAWEPLPPPASPVADASALRALLAAGDGDDGKD